MQMNWWYLKSLIMIDFLFFFNQWSVNVLIVCYESALVNNTQKPSGTPNDVHIFRKMTEQSHTERST